MSSDKAKEIQKDLEKFIKEQKEDEYGYLHKNEEDDENPWIQNLKFDPKTFEFHFEYDITFTGEYEKGTLKVPEEYPKGTYKLKKGKGIFEVIHSEKNFYETIHNIFKELDKERLGESTLPTPQSTLNNHHQTWTDIYSQIFQDEYNVWLSNTSSAKTKPKGNNKGGKPVIELDEVNTTERWIYLRIFGETEEEYLKFIFFYGKDYLEDFGDQSIKVLTEEDKLKDFCDIIKSWLANHKEVVKHSVSSVLEKCSDLYLSSKKRQDQDKLMKTPWYERVNDENKEAQSFFRTVWTPILGKQLVNQEVEFAVNAKNAIIKQLNLIKGSNTKSKGFEVRSFGQNVYLWQIKLFGFDKDYYSLHKDLQAYGSKFKTGSDIICEALFPSDYPNKPPFLRVVQPRLVYLTGNIRYCGTFTHIPALSLYSKHVDMISLISAIRQTLINGKAKVDLNTNWGYDKRSAGRTFLRERRNKFKTEGKFGGKFIVNNIDSVRKIGSFSEPSHDIERGNNILLPIRARELINLPQPIMLEYKTPEGDLSYCGVLDFCIGHDNRVVFPKWMMKHSLINDGDMIELRCVSLPRPNAKEGHFIKIQPHSKAFYSVKGNDLALSQVLSNFTTLAEGQTVPVIDATTGKEHLVQVVETEPTAALCIKVNFGEEIDLLYDVISPFDETLKKIEKDEFDETEGEELIPQEKKTKIVKKIIKKKVKKTKKEKRLKPKPEKQKLGDDEQECGNCKKGVKKSNQMHFLQCARMNYFCNKCETIIRNDPTEKKKHEEVCKGKEDEYEEVDIEYEEEIEEEIEEEVEEVVPKKDIIENFDTMIPETKETRKSGGSGGFFSNLFGGFGAKKEVKKVENENECPLCSFPGMSKEQYIDHLLSTHSDDPTGQQILQSLFN